MSVTLTRADSVTGANPRLASRPGRPSLSESVTGIVRRDLAPIVGRVDREGLYPEQVLWALGDAGAFAAHAAASGADGVPGLWQAIQAMAIVGRECLATSFCAWCQDALVWYLVNTSSSNLRERHLEAAAAGRLLGGTGLSNPLKAASGIEPLRLRGEPVAGGWAVSGVLPWVSNLGRDHVFGTVFEAPQARHVAAIVDCGMEGVELVDGSRFIALEGTRTFAVRLRRAFIPDSALLADPAEPFLARVRAGFVLLQAGMALGTIRGCIDAMERADRSSSRVNSLLPERPEHFVEAIQNLEREIEVLTRTPFERDGDYRRRVLEARLSASTWTLRAAQAAMLHAGATGFLAGSVAERKLREAYFVAIVTPSVKHLRLELSGSQPGAGAQS